MSLADEAWLRLWGALGAQVMADRYYTLEPMHATAQELADFKSRQLYHSCIHLIAEREKWQ